MVLRPGGNLPHSIRYKLEGATQEELQRAAESVVDAAINCQAARSGLSITGERRAALIEAVLQDPTLTEFLFKEDAFNLH